MSLEEMKFFICEMLDEARTLGDTFTEDDCKTTLRVLEEIEQEKSK